jgi:hypothetical protein
MVLNSHVLHNLETIRLSQRYQVGRWYILGAETSGVKTPQQFTVEDSHVEYASSRYPPKCFMATTSCPSHGKTTEESEAENL